MYFRDVRTMACQFPFLCLSNYQNSPEKLSAHITTKYRNNKQSVFILSWQSTPGNIR
jgi:hypothetical protein